MVRICIFIDNPKFNRYDILEKVLDQLIETKIVSLKNEMLEDVERRKPGLLNGGDTFKYYHARHLILVNSLNVENDKSELVKLYAHHHQKMKCNEYTKNYKFKDPLLQREREMLFQSDYIVYFLEHHPSISGDGGGGGGVQPRESIKRLAKDLEIPTSYVYYRPRSFATNIIEPPLPPSFPPLENSLES